MNFKGMEAILFEVTPADSEGARHWANAGGLGVFLWRRDLSRLSNQPCEGAGEPGRKSIEARETFEAPAADDSPGSPGARFRAASARLQGDDTKALRSHAIAYRREVESDCR